MPYQPTPRAATITNGQTASSAVSLGANTVLGVRFPSTFDGTTVTFSCSDTLAGTYDPVCSADGTTYTVTCAATRYTAVDYTVFLGALYLKVVAGTAQSTTDTILTIYIAPVMT